MGTPSKNLSSPTHSRHPAASQGIDEKSSKLETKKLNFMSPTISAASKKVNLPNKRVLAERNDCVFNSNTQKPPNSMSRSASLSTDSRTNEQNLQENDLYSKPYDPVTNYLSPRPQFLRYKPNRLQEILSRTKNVVEESNIHCSLSSESTDNEAEFSVSFEESQEAEEFESSDEEFEEEEEEEYEERKSGACSVFMKILFLIFYGFYISSMVSPKQPIAGISDGKFKIQNFANESMKNFESNHDIYEAERVSILEYVIPTGFEEFPVANYEDNEEHMDVDLKTETLERSEQIEEMLGFVEDRDHQVEFEALITEVIDEEDPSFEIYSTEVGEESSLEMMEEEEDMETQETKTIENHYSENYADQEMFGFVESYDHQLELFRFSNVSERGGDGSSMDLIKQESDDELIKESIDEYQSFGGDENIIEYTKIQQIISAFIFLTVASVSLALTFLFKMTRKTKPTPQLPPAFISPSTEPLIEETPNLQLPMIEEKLNLLAEHYTVKPMPSLEPMIAAKNSLLDEIVYSSPSFASIKTTSIDNTEDYENSYQTRAPLIELLNEFDVGSISRSHSVSHSKVQAQFAAFSLSSDRSDNTVEKNNSTKERRKENRGVISEVGRTPVRRSSRIRSRVIASP